MNRIHTRVRAATHPAALPAAALFVVAVVAATALGACTSKPNYARDADTGAAAPATVRDMSTTPNAPESTAGVAQPTGRTGAAGDTLGSGKRGASPAGTPGATTRRDTARTGRRP